MEDIKNNKQQPMIIAVKGPSNDKKSKIACKLAEFLRYPLIDEEDIILNLQSSLSNSANELPFKVVTQISKTQLQLKLQVIINTPLSQYSHFDDLLQLAISDEACLVIVEYTTPRYQDHDYDVGRVPKLSIDTTKPFVVGDFVLTMLQVAESHMHKGKDNFPSEGSLKLVDEKITPQRCFTEAHAHEFSFSQEPKIGTNKLCCNYCEKSISGPTYQCIECDEFILHESCGQSHKIDLTLLKDDTFYPKSHPSTYNFPEEHKCKLCEHYSSECNDCLLQSHIKWGILPTIYSYEKHAHPLNFVIMPFWYEYEYKCSACEKYGKFVSYKCYSCNFDLHTFCAFNFLRYKVSGPWGIDPIQNKWDDGIFSTIRQLKISTFGNLVIVDIQIEYDKNGTSLWSDIHGETSDRSITHQVKLDYPDEYLTSIEGIYNQNYSLSIRSLIFTSNKRRYGPYGRFSEGGGMHFSSPVIGDKIVGFYGGTGEYNNLNAIGIYLEPVEQ